MRNETECREIISQEIEPARYEARKLDNLCACLKHLRVRRSQRRV